MITDFDPNDSNLSTDVTTVLAEAGYTLTDADVYVPTPEDLAEAAAWAGR